MKGKWVVDGEGLLAIWVGRTEREEVAKGEEAASSKVKDE